MKQSKTFLSLIFGLIAVLSLTACPGTTGTGGSPKLAELSSSQLSISTTVGQSKTTTFSFKNSGDAALTFSLSSSKSFASFSPSSGTLAAGESQTVSVTASCQGTVGTENATLTLTSNDPQNPSVSLELSLNCNSGGLGAYDITISFSGSGLTAARESIFDSAASRWSEVIVGDIEDVSFNTQQVSAQSICGFADTTPVPTVDDLLIFARIGPIDGNGNNGGGNILGQAGPRVIRANGKTIIGCMEFDEADVPDMESKNTFETAVLHEMGHVLGIGVLWNFTDSNNNTVFDFLKFQSANNNCGSASSFISPPVFVGQKTINAFATLGGSGNVPVEDEFGEGTQCGHWDEGVFDNELMTGFIENNAAMPLSQLTVASLEDMGYDVNTVSADSYALPSCSPNCTSLKTSSSQTEFQERLFTPTAYVNEQGELIWFK
ncbi:MAG: hypothetical protein KC422_03545 [Trueperaceae bacterium]|nr:hypothetical protein [Trueperaceae bacterium]